MCSWAEFTNFSSLSWLYHQANDSLRRKGDMLDPVGYSGLDHNNWMGGMNWEVISTASEFVGAVAVVASVIYLATQIKRQTTESKLAATRDLSAKRVEGMQFLLGDEALSEIYLRAIDDYDSLKGVDRIRASTVFHIMMRNAEQDFIHMGTGHADDPYLESVDHVLSRTTSFPGFRQWWKTTGEGFNKAFQTHINELMAATDETPVSSAFHLSNGDAT